MHRKKDIRPIKRILLRTEPKLPTTPGIYAFWWIGKRDQLLSANRHIILKGPGERTVNVEYRDWWPKGLRYPCLYVGKTTNIRNRFYLHLKRGSAGRCHSAHPENHKTDPVTTSCQLRWGIEHIFPDALNPLELIYSCVGFSYRDDFEDNPIVERFFEEDRLVGTWRPWFNIDSER